ncbi:MAG: glycosyltransferase [Candidatus Eremiobacteraeota bacterium]|nr:glycosyltransferase [Candidatus Eremiobacteraeota bacterium]
MLSRLVERKGISDVIEALRLLPNAELLIAGGPTSASLAQDFEARRLEQIAQDMGLGERVHFLGRVGREEIPSLLRSADVVACVPWYEPFGMVPLEAMACGIPVVASSVGGLIDTVVDGVTGFHVASRSPIALAGAVRSLLENNELRMHFGQAGRRRAVRRYGWNRIANDTLDVYGQVLAEYRTGMKKQTRAFTN